jgi:hypothetical protein
MPTWFIRPTSIEKSRDLEVVIVDGIRQGHSHFTIQSILQG